jgi:hypothetical protein
MSQKPDFTGEDRLLRTAQYRQRVDARVANEADEWRKNEALLLDAARMDLGLRNEQKQLEQEKLQLWEKNRATEAASYAAAAVPLIDLNSPDGEKELGNWMSYARANGVPNEEMQLLFGSQIRARDVKTELRDRSQVQELGEDGLIVYEAFTDIGVSSKQARRLAQSSAKAQKTLAYWQDVADKAGIPFVIAPEDLRSMKKRVGVQDTVSIATSDNTFDASVFAYDLDQVNAFLARAVDPQLKELAKQQAADRERTVKAEEQKNELTAAQIKKTKADAEEAISRAGLYGVGPAGASSERKDPAPGIFDF